MSGLLPHAFLLGIEIHRASIATAVAALAAAGRRNVRVCRGDLTLLLRQHLRPESLDEVWVFFPDPWLAQGDAGRRVLRHETVALMHRCLRARGQVWVATDVDSYAARTEALLAHPASGFR